MAISPDSKDWTWVLTEPCPECGLVASEVPPEDIGARVRADLPRWEAVLAKPSAGVRPAVGIGASDIWSPAEYACHVRDVFGLFAERLELMLTEDDPQFANWDQDATAIENDYAAQRAATVSAELVAAGTKTAAVFDAVSAAAWGRAGRRSNGSVFTTATLGQYFLHDVVHHLHDVNR